MATFDISRVDFDPRKHYTSVRMQQGRVLLDDDWNENERIDKEQQRRTQIDIIGPYGSPDDGFKIQNPVITGGGLLDFTILPGTLYVGGLRLEQDAPETFLQQKDWLQHTPGPDTISVERYDLVIIEAWEQPVSAIEDNALFEKALGGPDTTTRLRNMRKLRLYKGVGNVSCEDAWEKFKKDHPDINDEHERLTDAILQVTFPPNSGTANDLCAPSDIAGYLGAENQTIRVQLTSSNTLTWGFNNAAPLYRAKLLDTNRIALETAPKDAYHWPAINKVVEILPWSAELSNGEKVATMSGHMSKVATLDPDPEKMEFTLQTPITLPVADFGKGWDGQTPDYVYVRFWERGDDKSDPAEISFTTGSPVLLGNTGIAVTITGTQLRKEDFWTISVRPETPDLVVPWSLQQSGIPPHGIRRFFAPVGIIRWLVTAANLSGTVVEDCRKPFKPLTEIGTCIVVHPGQDIQAIVDRFKPGQDICLCFKNGTYLLDDAVQIVGKGHVKMTGCGKGSHVIVNRSEAAFAFQNCQNITVRDMSFTSRASGHEASNNTKHLNGVLTILECKSVLLENICAENLDTNLNFGRREATCVTVRYSPSVIDKAKEHTAVTISDSEFITGNLQAGTLIINSEKLKMTNNRFRSSLTGVGNQGIVVAGIYTEDVYLLNNSILHFTQGIHVGTSNNKVKKPDQIFSAGRVSIIGNIIENRHPNIGRREAHGIFVGNCRGVIVRDNQISLVRSNQNRRINGIRLYGHYGPQICIRDNFLENYGFDLPNGRPNYGIFITYLNGANNFPKWWIAEGNITKDMRIEGSGRPFRTAKMIYADRWREF